MRKITPKQFKKALLKVCSAETSADPNGWSSINPTWGHCAVVAVLAQAIFGGEILRASLLETEFSFMRSHYWNRLPNGKEYDFTADQFKDNYPKNLIVELRSSEYIIKNTETAKRYADIFSRLKYILKGE